MKHLRSISRTPALGATKAPLTTVEITQTVISFVILLLAALQPMLVLLDKSDS